MFLPGKAYQIAALLKRAGEKDGKMKMRSWLDVFLPLRELAPALEITDVDEKGKPNSRGVWIFEIAKPRHGNVLTEIWRKRDGDRVEFVIQRFLLDDTDQQYVVPDAKQESQFRVVLSYPMKTEEELLRYVKSKLKRYLIEYWPTPEEYDPGLTKQDWLKLLDDRAVFDKNSLAVMAAFYDMGGEATCKKLELEYGKTAQYYSLISTKLCQRVIEKTGCPTPPEKGENSRKWPVLFVGRNVGTDTPGSYSWKLRSALQEALREFGISKYLEHEGGDPMKKQTFEKNIILYGPPGTGKTYHSVQYAVAIIEQSEKTLAEIEKEDYDDVFARYKKYIAEGRIAFTTFHQSYGYEEFIEGIRPCMNKEGDGSAVEYEIAKGVFREFCEREIESAEAPADPFDEAWDKLLQAAYENDGQYEFTRKTGSKFTASVYNDKFRVVWQTGSYNTLNRAMTKEQWAGRFKREEVTGGTVWMFDAQQAIISALQSKFDLRDYVERPAAVSDNKVFIIDEINRGNISKIFGELITLIEPSKRLGQKEEAKAILPYSKTTFGVPNNVYILGTMNTADRSIAMLDTALRRRFSFEEMMPDPKALNGATVEGLDIVQMLKNMNEKIEVLYDREHTVGHAYFIPLTKKEMQTEEVLADIFRNKIIPLLQEYFYEDYEKIRLVLGDNKKQDESLQFIKAIENDYHQLFEEDPDIDVTKRYKINEDAFKKIEAYKSI